MNELYESRFARAMKYLALLSIGAKKLGYLPFSAIYLAEAW